MRAAEAMRVCREQSRTMYVMYSVVLCAQNEKPYIGAPTYVRRANYHYNIPSAICQEKTCEKKYLFFFLKGIDK